MNLREWVIEFFISSQLLMMMMMLLLLLCLLKPVDLTIIEGLLRRQIVAVESYLVCGQGDQIWNKK